MPKGQRQSLREKFKAESEKRRPFAHLCRRAKTGKVALGTLVIGSLFLPMEPAVASQQIVPGTDQKVEGLVADLPWSFEITQENSIDSKASEEPTQMTRFRFKSTEPYEETSDGKIYLRLRLSTFEHDTALAAESAFDELLGNADPGFGISYAWDQIFVSGTMVYHLHAPCLFSKDRFRQIVTILEGSIRRRSANNLRVMTCWCGSGCEEKPAEQNQVTHDKPSLAGLPRIPTLTDTLNHAGRNFSSPPGARSTKPPLAKSSSKRPQGERAEEP